MAGLKSKREKIQPEEKRQRAGRHEVKKQIMRSDTVRGKHDMIEGRKRRSKKADNNIIGIASDKKEMENRKKESEET